jgi:hypothetical protein
MILASFRGGQAEASELIEATIEQGAAGGQGAAVTWARSRALLTEGEAAEALYREAIDRLGRTGRRPDLARAHLLYGEWLRRQHRPAHAREQLHTACQMLDAIGMEAFADRARRELRAAGATARKRRVTNAAELTAQEAQIARLASRRMRRCCSGWSGCCWPGSAATFRRSPSRRGGCRAWPRPRTRRSPAWARSCARWRWSTWAAPRSTSAGLRRRSGIYQWAKYLGGEWWGWLTAVFYAACVIIFQPVFGVIVNVVLNGLFPGIAFSTRNSIIIAIVLTLLAGLVIGTRVRVAGLLNGIGVVLELFVLFATTILLLFHMKQPVRIIFTSAGVQGHGSYLVPFIVALALELTLLSGFEAPGSSPRTCATPVAGARGPS